MCAVDSHHILIVAVEDLHAAYKMDGSSAFLPQNAAIFLDQPCSADGVGLPGILVGTGHHHNGDIRMGGAKLSQGRQMGLLQIFCGFCVMVVIKDQKGRVQGADIIDHRRLCPASSRKAEVEIVKIQLSGENVLIGIAGTAGASALGDGRAIKHHRLFVAIVPGGRKDAVLLQADKHMADVHKTGKTQGNFPDLLLRKCDTRFIAPVIQIEADHTATLCDLLRPQHTAMLPICIQIKQRHIRACKDCCTGRGKFHRGHDRAHGNIGRIGGKPQSCACRIFVEKGHPFAGGLCHRLRHTAESSRLLRLIKAVNTEGRFPGIVNGHILVAYPRLGKGKFLHFDHPFMIGRWSCILHISIARPAPLDNEPVVQV